MGHSSRVRDNSALKHEFIKHWRQHLGPRAVLIALSGGVDSVTLFHLLVGCQRLLDLDLAVAHVHHGLIAGRQGRFRQRAAELARRLALLHELPLFTNVQFGPKGHFETVEKGDRPLTSEASLRELRHNWLGKWRRQWAPAQGQEVVIATAHTADDLLETQLLRLIRGTGPQGLAAMSPQDGERIRPLLFARKVDLLTQARAQGWRWVNDPSNQSREPLRNWLRERWLPELARREPRGPQNLARSLGRIQQALPRGDKVERVLERAMLTPLSLLEQRQVLAQYFRRCGFRDYTQSHIDEFLKRLDTNRKVLSFRLLGRTWLVKDGGIAVLQD